jgi:hypothetical protein
LIARWSCSTTLFKYGHVRRHRRLSFRFCFSSVITSGRRVAVYGDDPRPEMTRRLQGFLEELLGRRRVSLSRKPESRSWRRGIDGTIQLPPASTLTNVLFVDRPGAVGRFNSTPASLIQFGGIALHPAPQMVAWSAGDLVPWNRSENRFFIEKPDQKNVWS